MREFFKKIQETFPMGFSSLILFVLIIYLMVVVGKTIWDNYQSNKGISEQERTINELQAEVDYMENEIVYYGSQSFKEKQARAKLGYIVPGETAVSVPKDNISQEDLSKSEEHVDEEGNDTPNYILWWEYFRIND